MRIVFALYVLCVVAATFGVHEAAHGVTTSALGYDAFVRINSSGPVSGNFRSAVDEDITSAAGPVITMIQALIGALLVGLRQWRAAFVVVAAALMMRALAVVASLRLPNDEARLGQSWGVGYWTVHIAVVAVLVAVTVWAARRSAQRPGELGLNFAIITVSMIAVVAVEPYLPTLYLSGL